VDARRHLKIAETLSRDTQNLRFTTRIYLSLAHLNSTEGEFDEARRYVELAIETAGPEPSDAFLGLVHRCNGYLHGRRSNWSEAVAYLEESLKLLERTDLPVEVGKTLLSLGIAYANRDEGDDRGRACEHLNAALSIFRQTQAQGYLAQVEVWLEDLGCRS